MKQQTRITLISNNISFGPFRYKKSLFAYVDSSELESSGEESAVRPQLSPITSKYLVLLLFLLILVLLLPPGAVEILHVVLAVLEILRSLQ